MNSPSLSGDYLEGKLVLGKGKEVVLSMPQVHWEGLYWLVQNESAEGETAQLVLDAMGDPNRGSENDSQVVMWFVELYMNEIFNES